MDLSKGFSVSPKIDLILEKFLSDFWKFQKPKSSVFLRQSFRRLPSRIEFYKIYPGETFLIELNVKLALQK